MRPKEKYIDPVAVDPDGIAEAQALAGVLPLTLNGALIVGGIFTGDYARRVGILSAADDSGVVFTIVGTDPDGKVLTEAVTGSGDAPGTAESTGYFKTVISITSDGAATGNVSAGTVDEFATNTIPINSYNSDAATVSIEAVSGVFDVTVQETYSRLQLTDSIQFVNSPMGSTSAGASSDMSNHATGVRLICNSYASGAELRMIVNQNGFVNN